MTEIKLKRLSGFRCELSNSLGKTAIIDGSKSIGGTEDGLRPMELLLMGLAGCSGFDVLSILQKGRQDVRDFEVTVKGERAETVPAVFTRILVHYEVSGPVELAKLERAVSLSLEKYCSVSAMLGKTAKIESTCAVRPG